MTGFEGNRPRNNRHNPFQQSQQFAREQTSRLAKPELRTFPL
jgi:hypothetical protein